MLFFLLAGYFGYKIYEIYQAYQDSDRFYDSTRSAYTMKRELDSNQKVPIDVDWESLLAVNPDIVGWIFAEGVDISYPVLQGSDNEYYLKHTLEGDYNFAGSIFMDYQNEPDLSDCNTIIYGHNMKNGSMFGSLKKYSNEDAYAVDPYFWILTPDANYRYEIQSAYT